ncbi:MAG: hypothetical protein EOP19_20940 [Hyphomicrobiales bacterium]|nr:MAG: hypothetical protein EOP19_20940 [Hyphomicrobiales bacterium]
MAGPLTPASAASADATTNPETVKVNEMSETTISDKGLSILTFAAYHALSSGETVGQVVIDDGNGHVADPDGLTELSDADHRRDDRREPRFTSAGEARLAAVIAAIRAAKG